MEPIINVMNTRSYERAYDRAETIAADTTFAGVPILI